MLDVNGDLRVRGKERTSAPSGACDNPGTITYYNDNFYGCTSAGWRQLDFVP